MSDATVASLVDAADSDWVLAQIMRYTRDLAFGVAAVYAKSAERRGTLGARLEAQMVDAIARGTADEGLLSRASAIGWGGRDPVCVLVGGSRPGDPDQIIADLVRTARNAGSNVLAGVHGDRLVVVLELAAGNNQEPLRAVEQSGQPLLDAFGPGPVVFGAVVENIAQAPLSAAAALAGHRAARLAVDPPRLVGADDLLTERALDGDRSAVDRLQQLIYNPLMEAGDFIARTVWTYLEAGESIQHSANLLHVHHNTIRYRLKRAAQVTGFDPTTPRDRQPFRTALVTGRADNRHVW